jgi:hypothetical protein
VFQPLDAGPLVVHAEAFFREAVHPATVVARAPSIVVGMGVARKEAVVRNFPELALQLLEGHD